MALARFFGRVYASAGRALAVSAETLAGALSSKPVVVICGESVKKNENDWWTAELTINLLARLYPTVVVTAPPEQRERLEFLAKRINPAISMELEQGAAPSAVIAIGEDQSVYPAAIHVRADGWVARCAAKADEWPERRGPANPFAAGAAACLGAWELFRRVFRDSLEEHPSRDLSISLLDFGESAGAEEAVAPTALDDVAFVGLGAVANGAFWALSKCADLSGSLALVEPQSIDVSNLQRYVLTADADERRSKIDLIQAIIAGTRLTSIAYPESLEAFADRWSDSFVWPTICVSVDNVRARRFVQALLPRLVINGCTSDDGLGASWHEFDGPSGCLACLYYPQGPLPNQTDMVAKAFGLSKSRARELYVNQKQPTVEELDAFSRRFSLTPEERRNWTGKSINKLYTEIVCGAVGLNLRSLAEADAVPLAHQSALAGILMAAELVKRRNPKIAVRAQAHPVVQLLDVRVPPPRANFWTQPRAPHCGCICSDDDYQRAFSRKWRGEASALP